jgi:hypothetical protein
MVKRILVGGAGLALVATGTVAGNTSTGVNTTFTGTNGCHYIRLSGVPLAAAPNADGRNAAGLPVKG